MATPLASADDLAQWFPGVAADDERLLAALDEASARFRGAVRHYVSAETETTVTLDGLGQTVLRLPALNVVADSVTCSVGDDELAVQVSADGVIARVDGSRFPAGLGNVAVTFDAGYPDEAIPEEIKAAVLDQAKILLETRRGVRSMATGPFSVTYAGDDGGVSQQWADVVEAYRIRRGDRS